MKNKKRYNILAGFALLFAFIVQTSCGDMEKDFEGEPLVTYPEITVTGFSPVAGPPGAAVTITGTNFGEYMNAAEIQFNGVKATEIISYSDTQIVVRAPMGATTGPIKVRVWTHTVTTDNSFEYLPGANITAITPAEGMPGDRVIITGTNFGTDPAQIKVVFSGNVEADVISVSDTEMEVEVPAGGVTGALTVTVGLQTLAGPEFLYLDAYPPGKYLFEFDDPADVQWITVQNSTYVVEDGKLKVTFDPNQFTGTSKRRADLQYVINGALLGQPKDPWVYTSEYPILAIKMKRPATGNFTLDATGAVFTNNTYKTDFAGQEVYYYNIPDRVTQPTAEMRTFQFKVADITSAETGYEVDWIGTFRSVQELQDYINQ